MTMTGPSLTIPSVFQIPLLTGTDSRPGGSPAQLAAAGGSIINSGTKTITISSKPNFGDPNAITVAVGGTVPWPESVACWAWVVPSEGGPGEAVIIPIQLPYSPGGITGQPVTFPTPVPVTSQDTIADPDTGASSIAEEYTTLPFTSPPFGVTGKTIRTLELGHLLNTSTGAYSLVIANISGVTTGKSYATLWIPPTQVETHIVKPFPRGLTLSEDLHMFVNELGSSITGWDAGLSGVVSFK